MESVSDTKLLPCPNPWCKPDNRRALCEHSTNGKKKIHCECGIGGPYCDTREDAIAAWNTRVPDPRIAAARDMADALKAFLEAWDKSHQLEKTDVARRMAEVALEAWEKLQ